MSQNPYVLLRVEDGVAELRFNRPDDLNALTEAMVKSLQEQMLEAVARDDVGAIILSAEGRAWMAGGDLNYFYNAEDRPAAADYLVGMVAETLKILANAPQIAIASVNGPVAGGGLGIALSCDMIIAADDAVFATAYAGIAMSPDCGMSWALPRLVGLHKAMELVLLAERISAKTAGEIGMVNRVVPRDRLDEETMAIARRIARGGFMANAQSKRLLRRALQPDFAEQLDAEREGFVACTVTDDFHEGMSAFFEKRNPVFCGRRSGNRED